MPDVQEVFRLATQKVRPDPGALERQHRNQQWRVVKRKTGVYALVAGLVIAGLVISVTALRDDEDRTLLGRRPAVSDLIGVWRSDGGQPWGQSLLLRFSPDGTFASDERGLLDTTPAAVGTYELNDGTITFTASIASQWCATNDTWAWEAALSEDGRLKVVVVDLASGECTGYSTPTSWTRVSPSSPAGVDIKTIGPAEDAPPPVSATELDGIWLLEGTGQLLRLTWSGTYSIDNTGLLDTNPLDVGTFEIEGSTMTFTSGALSRGCTEGDRMIWKDVRFGGGRSLEGTVSEEACTHSGGVTGTWIRVGGY